MFHSNRPLVLCAAIFGVLAASTISGCGNANASPTPLDPSAAEQILSRALESWKAGEAHGAPARSTPPIRVADEQWLGGTALLDFALGERDKTMVAGTAIHWPVTLSVRNARGKTVKEAVTYLVTTSPEASVIRQD
jgi:hypothetical protein